MSAAGEPGEAISDGGTPEGVAGPPLTRRERVALATVLATAFVVRAAWALAFTRPPVFVASGDAYSYDFYARQIAAGNGYLNMATGEATAYYPVGYPAILGAVYRVVDHVLAGTMLNVVAGTASVALVFVIGRRVLGVRGGLVAAALVAVHPNLVFYVASLHLETVFTALCLGCVALLVTHDWAAGAPSGRRLVVVGLAIGVTAMVRPFVLPLVAVLVVVLVVAGLGWRRAVRAGAVVGLVALMVLVPWTVRNLYRFDTPVLLSSNMGDTVCMDRWSGADGNFGWANHEGCAVGLDEDDRNAASIRRALRFVLTEPGHEMRLVGRRAFIMMRSDHDGLGHVASLGHDLGRWERPVERLADVWFLTLWLAALVGVLRIGLHGRRGRLASSRAPARAAVLLTAATLLVIPLGLWGSPRFHVPAVPLLAVLAAAALTRNLAERTVDRGPGEPDGRRSRVGQVAPVEREPAPMG